MAHYIAELMKKEKTAKSEKHRNLIRKQCSELIMRLWIFRYKFDSNNPINSLNQNIKILVGEDPFRRPFLSHSDKEETQEESDFEQYLNSIIKLSEYEKQVIFSAMTADASEEISEGFSNEDGQESETEFEINITNLINYRDRLTKDNPVLEGIISTEPGSERNTAVMQALWDISKKRRKIIKRLSGK